MNTNLQKTVRSGIMGYHVIKINIPRPTSCQVCWIGRWKKFSFSQIKKKGKKVVHKKINQKDLRMRYTCCRCDGPRDGGRKSGSRGRLQRCARIKQLCPSVRRIRYRVGLFKEYLFDFQQVLRGDMGAAQRSLILDICSYICTRIYICT